MQKENIPLAYEAIQRAGPLKGRVTAAERDYIDALATRYTDTYVENRSALDVAYAEAMARLMAKYPDDTDAATLFADAKMNTMPWVYRGGSNVSYPLVIRVWGAPIRLSGRAAGPDGSVGGV